MRARIGPKMRSPRLLLTGQAPKSPPNPRAPGESTLIGAPPRAASLQPESDSPLVARPSHAAQSRGGGRSFGQQPARPEHSTVRCGYHRGHRS
jgi:hypothetical protein